MAPRSALQNISFTVDSASEDDMTHDELNALPTPDSNTENKAPTRKARGPAANTKAKMPAKAPAKERPAATRRVSGSSVLGTTKAANVNKKAPIKPARKVLAERNIANGSDTEEVDEFAEEDAMAAPKAAKRGRPAKAPKAASEDPTAEAPAPTKRGRKPTMKDTAASKDSKSKTASRSKAARQVEDEDQAEQLTIPETQADRDDDAMDIEESIEMDEIPDSMPPPPMPSSIRAPRQTTKARQTSTGPRRAGSASDSERDPQLRRKVGDLTRKLEAMTVKYDALKDAASSGKESNFDQLKKKTEQIAKDQDALVKALKQQVAELQSQNSSIATMKREAAAMVKEQARLNAQNKKLEDSLASAQNENKALSSKLAAARSSAPPDAKAVPGSAVKSRSTGVVLPGTAEAAKEAQLAKHKVDLYSDLTNLVILGMKKNENDDQVYDCLQTGRNGSKLYITPRDPRQF